MVSFEHPSDLGKPEAICIQREVHLETQHDEALQPRSQKQLLHGDLVLAAYLVDDWPRAGWYAQFDRIRFRALIPVQIHLHCDRAITLSTDDAVFLICCLDLRLRLWRIDRLWRLYALWWTRHRVPCLRQQPKASLDGPIVLQLVQWCISIRRDRAEANDPQ